MDGDFSFLLWLKRQARGPWKQGRKKRGSITGRTDRANEANNMFIIWLCWLLMVGTNSFDVLTENQKLEVRTANYGPIDQSQHAKSASHDNKLKYLLTLNLEGSVYAGNIKLQPWHRLAIARLIKQGLSLIHVFPAQTWLLFKTPQNLTAHKLEQ